jgi:hypothetical protein
MGKPVDKGSRINLKGKEIEDRSQDQMEIMKLKQPTLIIYRNKIQVNRMEVNQTQSRSLVAVNKYPLRQSSKDL